MYKKVQVRTQTAVVEIKSSCMGNPRLPSCMSAHSGAQPEVSVSYGAYDKGSIRHCLHIPCRM